jgi:hypothetical protein
MSWQMRANGSVFPRVPDEFWPRVIEAMIDGLSFFLNDGGGAKYKLAP